MSYETIQQKMNESDDVNVKRYSAQTIADPYFKEAEAAIEEGDEKRAQELWIRGYSLHRNHPDAERLKTKIERPLSVPQLKAFYSGRLSDLESQEQKLSSLIEQEKADLRQMQATTGTAMGGPLLGGEAAAYDVGAQEQRAIIKAHEEELEDVRNRIKRAKTDLSQRGARAKALLRREQAGLPPIENR